MGGGFAVVNGEYWVINGCAELMFLTLKRGVWVSFYII